MDEFYLKYNPFRKQDIRLFFVRGGFRLIIL
jgi:hypothetical protein